MPDSQHPPQDTREFLAQWNAATEAHHTERLSALMRRLAAQEELRAGAPADPFDAVASPVLHALQVAANPGATVHDAIEFLAALVAVQESDTAQG